MEQLDVSIEINGEQVHAGEILYNSIQDACFQYAKSYLEMSEAAAISIGLPLQEEKFSAQETRAFFEGLLPEGFTRRSVARWMHVSEADYISILAGLGNECLGAVRVCIPGTETVRPAYERLSREQVAALAGEGATKSAELVTKSHLSLTGASGKVGLYYAGQERGWYLPVGEAPSTHIVKQSHVRLNQIVVNEEMCLRTARELGIEVPESFIINVGTAGDGEILFAIKRYDRIFDGGKEKISGFPKPLRLHQEDFAQALKVPSLQKYEPKQGGYLKRAFRLLASYSSDPIRDQLKLWDIIVFDYLIGNTDNHMKNLSLIYSKDLREIRLAPAYDIISTAVYESSTREMALSVGDEVSLDKISRESFAQAAKEIGLGTRMALGRFDSMCQNFKPALLKSTEALSGEGFHGAEELEKRILRCGGIAQY